MMDGTLEAVKTNNTPDAVNRLLTSSQKFKPQEQCTKNLSRVYSPLTVMAGHQS